METNAPEQIDVEAVKKARAAEIRAKQEELLTAQFVPLIKEKDIYYVAELHKYTMYESEYGWKLYTPEAVAKLMNLSNGADKQLFDDILREMDRMKEFTTISFHDKPKNVLNFLSTKDWLQPTEGTVHPIFDVLMNSLSDGKTENREHIEKCLVWKYMHPEDYKLPCITISGAGGAGKNEFIEQVLATVFGDKQVVVVGSDQAFGQFNGQMIGKTVVFIDEAIVEKSDAESLKRKVGNKTISINQKYGLQGTYDNTPWYWLGGNGTNGAVMLARDVTDRRYSVLTVKNSIMYWVAKHLGVELPGKGVVLGDENPSVQWYQKNQAILRDPNEVGVWLASIMEKWGSQEYCPSALHSQDYLAVVDAQKTVFEEAMEHVFASQGFSHIDGKTLYRIYRLICDEANDRKTFIKGRNKFLADARTWLEQHRPDVEWKKAKITLRNGVHKETVTSTSLFSHEGLSGPYKANDDVYITADDFGKERLRVIGDAEENRCLVDVLTG